MDEYNPMEEIGLSEDKQLVCSCHGIVSMNNDTRNLCGHFIKNGEKLFDIMSRYESISLYPSKLAKEGITRSLIRLMVPLLKVSGITDHGAYGFFKDDLRLMPGADRMLRYLNRLLPTYVNTSSYEHHMMNVSERIGFPMSNVNCSQISFDSFEIGRNEAKEIRGMISRVMKSKPRDLPDAIFEPGTYEMHGWDLVRDMDSMFLERIPEMDFYEELAGMAAVGSNEKSYALLEIRRQSGIDFNSTMYVGGDDSDHQAMDIVRDGNGLAISFNGTESAVRNSNVAVISSDSVIISVLAAEFYNEGIESVYELAENWSREHLENKAGPDRNLIDTVLERFPKKLPEVYLVDRDNADDIADISDTYRRRFYVSDNLIS